MTTISTIAANSWSITIGGGWIAVMLIGMGLCFVFMLSAMWLMRNGHGWAMCSRWWPQETPPTDTLTGTPAQRPDQALSPGREA
jgi:hypothetical protein